MLAHNVSAEIRRAISRGEFAPGQKLNEVALAERFGVSRNTLREAFAMLTSEGLCERIPNRGVFLATPSAEFITDTFRARAAIEPAALLWGTDLDVDRLEELNAEGRVAIEEEDDDLFIAVNQAFHHVVLSSMGSKTLGDTMDQLDAFLRLATLPILERDPSFNRRFIEVNERIVELLRNDDRQGASDFLQQQLLELSTEIIDMLERINNGEVG
ncbi:GntR family transcriptional regulator [Corynebacterium lujinxingii]|uniref:GntR family transcriptional regulator n=1 Tax=Corynebacterium lujinxingii TaxID=2763010 RepID=A0A7H0K0J5_9CORY|nr:GntR family transcriptional regulator [Corynebacterium lujinxingii]MBC3179445.1 GntR family transcriptional regulator [Corynebacterium lujinxingii]NNO11550.1 GntR family transcriptional regulator [Corynebacterium lujinxingii]QNP90811.1 GntR family transcriptional regulator [Corynebacterium lujinxingii]